MADSLEELEEVAPTAAEPQSASYSANALSGLTLLDAEIMPPATPRDLSAVRYEGRIRILEAFQYHGTLKDAPSWVDRNWAAFADWDPLRGIEAGPALRVPTHRGDNALARQGDYVVRQEVVLTHDMPPDTQLEVWPRDQFERYFIPTTSSQPRSHGFQDAAEDAA